LAKLKIRTYKDHDLEPDTTIGIPLSILRFAKKLVPDSAVKTLRDKGIDINLIVDLAQHEDIRGDIVEIEEHNKNRRIVVSIE
jgi:hypothetical protein